MSNLIVITLVKNYNNMTGTLTWQELQQGQVTTLETFQL